MNKIKRGVSLLLCSLLFGSAVTLGNVADVLSGSGYSQIPFYTCLRPPYSAVYRLHKGYVTPP